MPAAVHPLAINGGQRRRPRHPWNHGFRLRRDHRSVWQAGGVTKDLDELVAQGREHLATCAWEPAAAAFSDALALDDDDPRALDGLGEARYWLGDYDAAIRHRERAHACYRDRGDLRAAALVAVRLAQWHGLVHGNAAAMRGWLGHARRLVEQCGECPELGWVELFTGCIATDPAEREHHSRDAVDLGRRFDTPGLEYDALSYLGKARVEQGAVDEGMSLIDEAVAAVQGGLVDDPWAAGEIWCVLFDACEQAVDVARAEAWLRAVEGYVERTRELPTRAICRMHLGGLLTAAGRWDQAEEELATALEIYDRTYVGTRHEPVLRLAELRSRQGRFAEVEELLAGLQESPAAAPAHARALVARGELDRAAAVLDRALRPAPRSLRTVQTLVAAVDVAVARDQLDVARQHLGDLADLAATTELPAVAGLAARARGRLAAATGATDVAVRSLEDALALLGRAELPHEVAITRLDLARALAATSSDLAVAEARTALASLRDLGARHDADAAVQLLLSLGARLGETGTRGSDGGLEALTARQREVLDLVATGLTNAEIAEQLVLSERTVEDHVSNILRVLGAATRTEAAAQALRAGT